MSSEFIQIEYIKIHPKYRSKICELKSLCGDAFQYQVSFLNVFQPVLHSCAHFALDS